MQMRGFGDSHPCYFGLVIDITGPASAADLLPLLFGGKPHKIGNDSNDLDALNSPSDGPFDPHLIPPSS